MSPALLILLLASTNPSTHTATINPPHTQEATPMTSFPIRHPSQPPYPTQLRYQAPGPAHRGTANHGYPAIKPNPITHFTPATPDEHTSRPQPHRAP